MVLMKLCSLNYTMFGLRENDEILLDFDVLYIYKFGITFECYGNIYVFLKIYFNALFFLLIFFCMM